MKKEGTTCSHLHRRAREPDFQLCTKRGQGSTTSVERRLHGLLVTPEQRVLGEKEIFLFLVLFVLLIKSKQNWHV